MILNILIVLLKLKWHLDPKHHSKWLHIYIYNLRNLVLHAYVGVMIVRGGGLLYLCQFLLGPVGGSMARAVTVCTVCICTSDLIYITAVLLFIKLDLQQCVQMRRSKSAMIDRSLELSMQIFKVINTPIESFMNRVLKK